MIIAKVNDGFLLIIAKITNVEYDGSITFLSYCSNLNLVQPMFERLTEIEI